MDVSGGAPAGGAGVGVGAGAPPASVAKRDQPNIFTKCFQSSTRCIKTTPIEKVMNTVRIVNLINAAGMIASGVWGYLNIASAVFVIYLATYVFCFGLLLIAFELRLKKWENKMKQLFGFMFSPWGRTFLLIFVTSLLFGIDLWLPITIGVFTLINACFQCFVICGHPGFKEYAKVKKVSDPADLPEDQITAYLKDHPELVAQAVQQSAFPGSSPQAAPAVLPRPTAPPAAPRPAPRPAPRGGAPPAPAPRSSASRPAPPAPRKPAPTPPSAGPDDDDYNPFDH